MIDLNEVQPIGARAAGARALVRRGRRRLNERIEDVAPALLGEPNRALSTRAQLRFGRKGSVAVEIAGPKRGQWYDHENGVGGDALALVETELDLANGAACAWAMEWLGVTTGKPIGPSADPSLPTLAIKPGRPRWQQIVD